LIFAGMGTTLNAIESLGPPFRSVDEQVFFMPRHGRHEIANQLFKVIVLLEGDCLHQVDNEQAVPFVPGDVIVVPRVCRQRYLASAPRSPRRVHALRLVFDPEALPPLPAGQRRPAPRGDTETDFSAFVRLHFQETRHLPGAGDETLRALLTELRHEAEQRRPGYRHRATALCMTLVVHVARALESRSGQVDGNGTPARRGRAYLVLQAKEYLLKNLAAELRLDTIAWHLGVSPEHLARTFRRETRQTVFAYLQQLRLERAKTYLLGSGRSITAIAEETGFSSVALFSRNFKRYAGRSPLAYRQERWEEGEVEGATNSQKK
jgi:AraC-like DNA-binding protein